MAIPLQFAQGGEQWHALEFDAKFQKKREVVTGRVLVDIQGLDAGKDGGEGAGEATPQLQRHTSSRLHLSHTTSGLSMSQARLVEVTVVRGVDLVAKDKGGTSDPFVELRLGKQKHRTRVVKRSLSPEWKQTFSFDFSPGAAAADALSLVVFDEDKGILGRSSAEYMGSVEIALGDMGLDEEASEWHGLRFDSRYQKTPETITGRLLVKIKMKLDDAGGVDLDKVARPARNPRHICTYIQHIYTYIYIHIYIHTCMYICRSRVRRATRGGRGNTRTGASACSSAPSFPPTACGRRTGGARPTRMWC